MKTVFRAFAIMAVTFLLGYLSGAFIGADSNVWAWDQDSRLLLVYLTAVAGGVGVMIEVLR